MDQAVMEIHFTTMDGILRIVVTVLDAVQILPDYALPLSNRNLDAADIEISSKVMGNTHRTTLFGL